MIQLVSYLNQQIGITVEIIQFWISNYNNSWNGIIGFSHIKAGHAFWLRVLWLSIDQNTSMFKHKDGELLYSWKLNKKKSKYALLDGSFVRLKWQNTFFLSQAMNIALSLQQNARKKKINQMIKKPSKCTIRRQKS